MKEYGVNLIEEAEYLLDLSVAKFGYNSEESIIASEQIDRIKKDLDNLHKINNYIKTILMAE